MEINVEDFCILKARVGGHRMEQCPQCKALKAMAIEVNNATLDSIIDLMEKTAEKEDAVLDPKKALAAIRRLKHPS